MAYEQKEGTGTLSKSKHHKEGDKKPTHYGDILLNKDMLEQIRNNGYKLPLSAWEKSGQYGVFYSLSVDYYNLKRNKWEEEQTQPSPEAQNVMNQFPGSSEVPDDSIPF